MNCCICHSSIQWPTLILGVVEWREETSTDIGPVCNRCDDELVRSRSEVLEAIRAVVVA